ncbi:MULTISPECIES: LURP-one-related family protein [unclassified Enterococcus]|uniref:LURP-one-related/scramblase family protein n=1 Tax=unclassified Enterococcus TaxID=2608891 RepID=UPI001557089F|nr:MULTISPECIES: LURP-one-related family protein [unclassified Enterococcus]MBS7576552.1 LURP-one-related family protein [Enterococcus sp. MMGLQ5-2]MBS7583961.1 LURP-one-related family protein [Enterococcus sp. MMGLQ5-1]NPD11822.1 hypothetical protein [Enterococcus sp. MMGLQ5-1]NPD36389.1 hypothetical protein [Enterococcus sp. MMGLQ5-2]
MKNLYIKQKVFSIGEKFTVFNQNEEPEYLVQGSFFKIPKAFVIEDKQGNPIAKLTKKVFSFLPKFFLELADHSEIVISKSFSFFHAHYEIEGEGIEVRGNFWDMDFEVLKNGRAIAEIHKKWFSWGDTYEIQILDESLEKLIISVVIAIDCVKNSEKNSAASSSN